jgi:hypothetical protein
MRTQHTITHTNTPSHTCAHATQVDTFDPFKVPTLRALVRQIDRYDQEHAGDDAAKGVPGTEWMGAWMNACMHGWMGGWLVGWMEGI